MSLLGQFTLFLNRHAVVETFFVLFYHYRLGDFGPGDFVAGGRQPDCCGDAGELGGVGGEAGGEGEGHCVGILHI